MHSCESKAFVVIESPGDWRDARIIQQVKINSKTPSVPYLTELLHVLWTKELDRKSYPNPEEHK